MPSGKDLRESWETSAPEISLDERISSASYLILETAHELCNSLNAVVGYSELLMRSGVNGNVGKYINMVHREASLCKKFIRCLLNFSKGNGSEKVPLDINEVIREAVDACAFVLKNKNIVVEEELDMDLPPVDGDPIQLRQVFVNIIINAERALRDVEDRRLSLRSSFDRLRSTVRVEIENNGPNIPPEHIRDIFNPFFSMRDAREGSGLGLAMCRRIVERHNGTIYAENVAERRVNFVLNLPAAELGEKAPGRRGGKSKEILVIDDEKVVLDLISEVLSLEGYEVDTADGGLEALEKIRRKRYCLILIDIKMPGINGRELYEKMLSIDPEIIPRVIFTTGDTLGMETREFLKKGNKRYITKPFGVEELKKLVTEVLFELGDA